jgi:ElaB/YqjD/DUF883 family membrane-anchored ribosome-binding protein
MTMGNETSSTNFGGETSGSPEAVASAGQDVKQDAKRLGSEVAALASAKVGQARDAAQEYLQAGKDKAQQAYESGSARAQEYYQTGKDKAQEYMETGRDKAQEYYDLSKAKAQEWESDVEQYIREKPLQSVLIAAGVGAIFGLLLRR